MPKKEMIKLKEYQNIEANVLLRIVSLLAGVFTVIIIALLKRIYPDFTFYMLSTGIAFSVLYLVIFVLTFICNCVKKRALAILYTVYYLSSIAMLFSFYINKGDELFLKILLLVTFAVILGLRQMGHLVTYIIIMLIGIVFLFLIRETNGIDSEINITIFVLFFALSVVNLKSKLATEKALIVAKENIKQMAYYDAITGLPNRLMLNNFVSDLLNKRSRIKKNFAVLFIDLDNFKNINDSLGHSFGDRALTEAADKLMKCVRNDDIVARYAGDEFVIILNNIDEKDSILIINRIINEFKNPLLIEGHEIYTTTSVGVSLYPIDGVTVDALIKNADTAMYKAKSNGKSSFCFYTEDFNKTITRRVELENGLRRALEKNEFHLCYQPQVYLETGELWGIEALIRWHHPVLGIVSPMEFIPIAEDTSLIIPIGEWVLETACRQNKLWQESGLDIVPIAVNVSAIQLKQSNFVETVLRCLNKTKLDPKYLVVELTESIVQDVDKTFDVVNNLESLGVKVAIDDFGTGYSSLSLLKNLNIDILKIDSYFVKDIANNPNTVSIIEFICDMGDKLKFDTIIEGIECIEQSRILIESGCKLGQGYLFSKPISADELKDNILKQDEQKMIV